MKNGSSFCVQEQSLLFSKLISELRLLIYQYEYSNASQTVHIYNASRHGVVLSHKSCEAEAAWNPSIWEKDDKRVAWPRISSWGADHFYRCDVPTRRNSRELGCTSNEAKYPKGSYSALLLTCHRMYEEVHFDMYSQTTFRLHGDDLEPELWFLRTINPAAFQCLRSVILHFCTSFPLYIRGQAFLDDKSALINPLPAEMNWEALWKMFEKSNSLQHLHVRIFDRGFRLPEDALLRPLSHVRVPNFTVQLPWARDFKPEYTLESDEGHSYKLQRPLPQDMITTTYIKPQSFMNNGGGLNRGIRVWWPFHRRRTQR